MRREMLATALGLSVLWMPACAYDLDDKFSIGGVLAGASQCQVLSERAGADDGCRAVLPLQIELSFHPAESDEVFAKVGFASGNGLNTTSPFVLAPWAADLKDNVENINGSRRDYLLTAWYRHTFSLPEDNSLHATLGIIDAADYLDGVAYADDEYTQFMNEALTNAANVFLPSYDLGGALEWHSGRWSLTGVVMQVGTGEDGADFNFYGIELGLTLQSEWGKGNYKLLVDGTSKDFLNRAGTHEERRFGVLLSFDQQLGDTLGAFLRVARQADDAAINYKAIYSGGIDINGRAWGRAEDNIGVGYAYLSGGNMEISHTQAAEGYYRFVANDHMALSADLQYMKDELKGEQGPAGFIFGLRATVAF